MSYNASDRKDIRRAEKEAHLAEQAKIEYLRATLRSSQGRLWFYDLLESCHIFSDPFTGNPYTEAFLKGERNVGLRVYADIVQHCPDQFISMMKEAHERRQQSEQPARYQAPDPDRGIGEQSGSSYSGWDSEGSELEPSVGDV